MVERDRVTLCALLELRRHGVDVCKTDQRPTQRDDACSADPIIIGHEDEWAIRHALNDLSRKHPQGNGTNGSNGNPGGGGGRDIIERADRRAFALRSANGRGDWI